MKYYITADVHGFYTEFHKGLDEAGYFTDAAALPINFAVIEMDCLWT